jgi:hypothetical protein
MHLDSRTEGKHGLGTKCSHSLKAAELIAGLQSCEINAATMIAV